MKDENTSTVLKTFQIRNKAVNLSVLFLSREEKEKETTDLVVKDETVLHLG